jgi:hypothetical protein
MSVVLLEAAMVGLGRGAAKARGERYNGKALSLEFYVVLLKSVNVVKTVNYVNYEYKLLVEERGDCRIECWPACARAGARGRRLGIQHTLTAIGLRSEVDNAVTVGRVRIVLEAFEIIFGAVIRFMQVGGANGFMMGGWMMLGEVVSSVRAAFSPIDEKLSLSDAVSYPIKTHVHGFGPFLFDAVVGNAGGSAVVSLDRSGRLWMSEFDEAGT